MKETSPMFDSSEFRDELQSLDDIALGVVVGFMLRRH
jgi:hypothetical protein